MAPNDNFISRAVQNGVAAAGGFAGGIVDSAGRSVQGAGRGVGNRCPPPQYNIPFFSSSFLLLLALDLKDNYVFNRGLVC